MKLSQYDLKEHMFIVYTRHVKKKTKKTSKNNFRLARKKIGKNYAALMKKDHDLNKYVRIVAIIKFWSSMSFFDAI
jgi:uncharacterized membrane protein